MDHFGCPLLGSDAARTRKGTRYTPTQRQRPHSEHPDDIYPEPDRTIRAPLGTTATTGSAVDSTARVHF